MSWRKMHVPSKECMHTFGFLFLTSPSSLPLSLSPNFPPSSPLPLPSLHSPPLHSPPLPSTPLPSPPLPSPPLPSPPLPSPPLPSPPLPSPPLSCPPVDVWTLAFSADSRYLATGSHNGKINLFSVEEGKKQTALDTRGKFTMSIAYVSQGFI